MNQGSEDPGFFMEVIYFLLGIEGQALDPNATWNLGWENAPETWILILLIIPAVLLFGYLIYRYEPDLSTGRQILLATFRIGAISVLLIMLFQPYLYNEIELTRESNIALMVDNSGSMSFTDRYRNEETISRLTFLTGLREEGEEVTSEMETELEGFSRLELLNRIRNNPDLNVMEELSRDQILRMYTFARGIQEQDPDQTLEESENAGATAMGNGFRDVIERQRGYDTSAIILFSDGQSNAGEDPVSAVEYLKNQGMDIPIHTVATGARYPPLHVNITELQAPDTAQVGAEDPVLFQVTIRSNGFLPEDDRQRTLQLETEQGRILTEKQIQMAGDGEEQEEELQWRPSEPGEYNVTVRVPAHADEIETDSNSVSHRIEVVDEKIRVFYIENDPRYDFRFLQTAMIRDNTIEAQFLLAEADQEYPQAASPGLESPTWFPQERQQLAQLDVIIIGDVHPDDLGAPGMNPEPVQERIVDFVNEMGGGVLFLAGEEFNPRRFTGTPLEELLPVTVGDAPSFRNRPVQDPFYPSLTVVGRNHPVMQLRETTEENTALWEGRIPPPEGLRPLHRYYPVQETKLGASTLARIPGDPVNENNRPLIAVNRFGRGRTMFVGTDETFRWRELRGDTLFYRFWNNSVRWLQEGRLLSGNRHDIQTDKEEYHPGEDVEIFAHLLDENYEPATRSQLTAHVTHEGVDREQLITLHRQQPGQFRGTFQPDETGEYSIWIGDEPSYASESEERDFAETRIRVRPQNLEAENPNVDAETLKTIARESGGTFFWLDEIRSRSDSSGDGEDEKPPLADIVYAEPETLLLRPEREPLWNAPLLFLLFLVFLSLEWILRKRSRLI